MARKEFKISAVIDFKDHLSGRLGKLHNKLTLLSGKLSVKLNKLNRTKMDGMVGGFAKSLRLMQKIEMSAKRAGKFLVPSQALRRGSMRAGATATGFTLAGAYSANRLSNRAGEFEKYYAQIERQHGGGEEATTIIKGIENLGVTTKFTQMEMSKAYTGSMMVFKDQTLEMLDAITNMAAVTGEDLERMKTSINQVAVGDIGEVKRLGFGKELIKGVADKFLITFTDALGEDRQYIFKKGVKNARENQRNAIRAFALTGAGGNEASLKTYDARKSNFIDALDRMSKRFYLSTDRSDDGQTKGALDNMTAFLIRLTNTIDKSGLGDRFEKWGDKFGTWLDTLTDSKIDMHLKDFGVWISKFIDTPYDSIARVMADFGISATESFVKMSRAIVAHILGRFDFTKYIAGALGEFGTNLGSRYAEIEAERLAEIEAERVARENVKPEYLPNTHRPNGTGNVIPFKRSDNQGDINVSVNIDKDKAETIVETPTSTRRVVRALGSNRMMAL